MGSRPINLDFILTKELAEYLCKVSSQEICSQDLKNKISQLLERKSVIPFPVLNDCYHLTKKLSNTCQNNVYLPFWKIFLTTSVVLPAVKQNSRNQSLDAHFEDLKNKRDNICYQKMTRDIGSPLVFSTAPKAQKTCFAELKCAKKQLVMVLNFIFIVVSAFVFGCFLPDLIFSGHFVSLFLRMVCGLFCSATVLAADFYFLVRNFSLLEKVYE
ncbi:unnamed protein product [Schistosoma turkestanicum]|nr:unnamed protein product [Schistosoma turkestanicum]